MLLMPATQAAMWISTIMAFSGSKQSILEPIAAISVVMWLWAIRQRLGPTPQELGVFTWPLSWFSLGMARFVHQKAGNGVGIAVAVLMFLNVSQRSAARRRRSAAWAGTYTTFTLLAIAN